MSSPNAYDYTISRTFGNSTPRGEIGLEIEVEGRNLPGVMNLNGEIPHALDKTWSLHQDGSLRNLSEDDQAIEYVLSKPLGRGDFVAALAQFEDKWKAAGSTAHNSYRTSVHVHLNVGDWSWRTVWSFLTTYFILEEALVSFADGGTKARVGNKFCLRAIDSDAIITTLSSIGRRDFSGPNLSDRDLKYGAVNVAALQRYGSLEFRSLRGTVDPELIKTWVDILLAVKDYSSKYDNPTDIINEFSEMTPMVWAERVLGRDFLTLLQKTQPNIDQTLVYGTRTAQEVAYSCDWKPYVKPEAKTKTKDTFRSAFDEYPDDNGAVQMSDVSRPVEVAETAPQGRGETTPGRFRINPTSTTNYGVRI